MYRIFFLIFLLGCCSSGDAAFVKEPNVAGGFYSSDAKELSDQITSFIQQASINSSDKNIQALIVPHAGYVYSGKVAAYGYKAVSKNHYTTVVILAPSHYFPFDGISFWPQGGFKTPLGIVDVDEDFTKKLMDATKAVIPFAPNDVFQKEHSLEVQLPFIQKTFGNVKIVPIMMGNPDPKVCQTLAFALNELIGGRGDVLVLASSDMSHYYNYDTANTMDTATLGAIQEKDAQKLWNGCFIAHTMEMCGVVPVVTLLLYAKERGLNVEVLFHANSGDTAGDKSKVVGYSSVIFYSQALKGSLPETLTESEKKDLLSLARNSVESFVKNGKVLNLKTNDAGLLRTQGAFVTLREHGQLRGCIGNIVGDKPLWDTVKDMAVAAASKDPRFAPVKSSELKDLAIEISVLSIPQRVSDPSAIVLGRDGVIVSDGGYHQGVFLPQVAKETHWSKEEFLAELCSQKADLPADCWKDSKNSLFTFQADVF